MSDQDSVGRKSRLVTLVYKVLSKFIPPQDRDSDSSVYSRLASAFHRQAADSLDEERRDAESDNDNAGYSSSTSSKASRSPNDR